LYGLPQDEGLVLEDNVELNDLPGVTSPGGFFSSLLNPVNEDASRNGGFVLMAVVQLDFSGSLDTIRDC